MAEKKEVEKKEKELEIAYMVYLDSGSIMFITYEEMIQLSGLVAKCAVGAMKVRNGVINLEKVCSITMSGYSVKDIDDFWDSADEKDMRLVMGSNGEINSLRLNKDAKKQDKTK